MLIFFSKKDIFFYFFCRCATCTAACRVMYLLTIGTCELFIYKMYTVLSCRVSRSSIILLRVYTRGVHTFTCFNHFKNFYAPQYLPVIHATRCSRSIVSKNHCLVWPISYFCPPVVHESDPLGAIPQCKIVSTDRSRVNWNESE